MMMRMIKLVILFLMLTGGECDRSQMLTETSDRHKKLESLMESAVLSLLSCYGKRVDTVGGMGITEQALIDILMTKQPLPVKLFGTEDEKRAAPIRDTEEWGPHKLHLFVAEPFPETKQFQESIERVSDAQQGPHLATYLIIEWPSRSNQKGCSKATDYLWGFWADHILNAFYVCVDKLEEKVFVYTYNPYTSQAPAPWTLNKTIIGYYDHPWSQFVREYRPSNKEICNNLDFVKTHDLGGYPVRCFIKTGLPLSRLTPELKKGLWSRGISQKVVKLALKALNATSDLFLIGRLGNDWVIRDMGSTIPLEKAGPSAEIVMPFHTSTNWRRVPVSIPFLQTDFAVVTHHSGGKSQLEKLIGVFDKRTRFGICLVIIMTVVFFYFFTDQSLGRATMNVIRIIGNTGLLRVPMRNAPRLYLAGIFILVVTIIGVYQGLLASLLTKPKPLPEIDTLEDLANSPHKIYIPGLEFIKYFGKDPSFNGRFASDERKCFAFSNKVLINPSEACVAPREYLQREAIEQNLHVSREPIIPMYAAYRIQWNWPLEKRFNEILRSFLESGMSWPVSGRAFERKMKIAEYKRMVEADRPVVMTLSNLGFAFAFLGIGLSLATIVLAIEIAMKRRQLGRRKTRLVKQRRVINVKEKKNNTNSI